MSPVDAQERRYRIRFAERGAIEITPGTVEFTLDLSDITDIPVVSGSIVHPIQGANEMRPFQFEAVDVDGNILSLFTNIKTTGIGGALQELLGTAVGRWDLVGRLVDLQYQETDEDPISGIWITYGTGRCSGFDESDGPGKFIVEISDESWKARKERIVFEFADTTCLWPPGIFRPWKGIREIVPAGGGIVDISQSGDLYAIQLRATLMRDPDFDLTFGSIGRAWISDLLLQWVREDVVEEPNFSTVGDSSVVGGNFKHLRLLFGMGNPTPSPPTEYTEFEIVTFGQVSKGKDHLFHTLENPFIIIGGTGIIALFIQMWVRVNPGGPPMEAPPPANGTFAVLAAPTSPPTDTLPLHVGVQNTGSFPSASIDHTWGVTRTGGGIHVADLHRRVWDIMGLRYNDTNLTQLEADETFPLLYPRVGADGAKNPEKYLETIRQAAGVVSMRDEEGRMKLVDVRPVKEIDYDSLPLIDATNVNNFTWSVLGRETINRIHVETEHENEVSRINYTNLRGNLDFPGTDAALIEGPPSEVPKLDGLVTALKTLGPYDGDTIDDVGERPYDFQAQSLYLEASITDDSGQPSVDKARLEYLMAGHIELYQDGLMRFFFQLGKTLADTIEEGTILKLDCESLKVPNPWDQARTGLRAIRVLGITRYPAYSDIDAILLPTRPIPEVVGCPEVPSGT